MESLRPGYLLVCLVSLVFGLTGCKQLQPVVSQTTSNERIVTITETLHDSTVVILPDSAFVKAFMECDSLNRVVMRELEIVNGRKVKPEVKFRYGVLEVTLPVDSEAVYISWKERHEQVSASTNVSEVTVVKEKPPWYLRFRAEIALIGIILFLVATQFIKPKNR